MSGCGQRREPCVPISLVGSRVCCQEPEKLSTLPSVHSFHQVYPNRLRWKQEEEFYTFSYLLKYSYVVRSRVKTKTLSMILISVLGTYPAWELAECSLRSLDGP